MNVSRRERRVIFAGGAVVAAALLWAFAVRPYLAAVVDLRTRLDAERELLSRERALLATADAYPGLFEDGVARLLERAPRLLPGANDAAAGAALARYVREHAGAAGVLLVRLAPLDPEELGGVAAIGLRVSAESDLEGLLTLVALLTEGGKLVSIESIRMTATSRSARAPVDGSEVLRAEFTVRGYVLRGVPDAPGVERGSVEREGAAP